MRDQNPSRGWRTGALCGVLAVTLCGSLLAASSVSTTATPSTKATPSTAPSKHTSGAANTGGSAHKTSAHKSAAHSSSSHKTSAQKTSSARWKKGSKSSRVSSRASKKRGQQAIDHERATAIQEALIREHYLQGEPSGSWDSATQAAMQKYQADQGWQSKTTPDSRALIKLGLGPSKDHLLNPESAMTSSPATGDPKSAAKPEPRENSLPQQ